MDTKNREMEIAVAKAFARIMGVELTDEEILRRIEVADWCTENQDVVAALFMAFCKETHTQPNPISYGAFCEELYAKRDEMVIVRGKDGFIILPVKNSTIN